MDKQIIFDDVDVKDCIAYAKSQTVYLGNTVYKQMEKICMVKNQPCKFFDCQFKQMARELKAKEQECEFSNLKIIQLQETLSQYETDLSTKDCIVETCKAQYKELEAENERLKKEIRLYDCIDKWGTEQCRCACRCLGNEFCDAAEGKMKNIKQTLADIKEIAKKTLNMVDYKTYFKRDNKSLKQEGFKALNEILQKISEVEK